MTAPVDNSKGQTYKYLGFHKSEGNGVLVSIMRGTGTLVRGERTFVPQRRETREYGFIGLIKTVGQGLLCVHIMAS